MQNSNFYIAISIQTADGPMPFGRFDLGHDRASATELFKKLKGSSAFDPKDLLFIEFMEMVNSLPVNIDMLSCDLQELGVNTMLITQEVFRLYVLKAGK
jgi:hypothetical protein